MTESFGALDEKIARLTEQLAHQHFDVTLVFSQGPVQEASRVPEAGRKGLNFYSRLTALAAAEMLDQGITEKVVLSGGETGARAGKEDASTEANLMADVIVRHLGRGDDTKKFITIGGKKKLITDVITRENKAKDSLQNLAFILKGLDSSQKLAFLGIGFHAHDTVSGAGEGRLEVLADLFGIPATVYSAEGILRDLVAKPRADENFVGKELKRLTHESLTHTVSVLKSEQEAILVKGLRAGDWLRIVPFLDDQNMARTMIVRDPYVMRQLQEQLSLDQDTIRGMDFTNLLDALQKLRVEGSKGYGEVKEAVMRALGALSSATGIDYLGRYGKPTFTY